MSVIAISSKTSLSLGTRTAGTALGTKISAPKICFIGDSITVDSSSTPADSFRYPLHTMLTASGLSPTYVGNQTNGTSPSSSHRASVGKTIVDHSSGGDPGAPANIFDTVAYISGLASGSRPDVCIVHLGTNDALNGTATSTAANFAANLTTFIGQLEAIKTMRYVVCVPPLTSGREGNMPTIRSAIPTTVATLAGGGTLINYANCNVLQGTSANGKGAAHYLLAEANGWLHPRADGYIFLADAMFPAVVNACGYAAVWYGQTVS